MTDVLGDTRPDVLTRTVALLSEATTLERVTEVVAESVREATGADGATFVLREDGFCFYADENAISPLWKGRRFPLTACVSGWAMMHRETVAIPDIYDDERVPVEAYRPTFVKSMSMVPIRTSEPIGALGAYWAEPHEPSTSELRMIEILANSAAVAVENLELRGAVVRRSEERDRAAARVGELETAMFSLVHDLRSPLGAITGFAELIVDAEQGQPGATTRYAEAILHAGERMAGQIERMLGIYRITSGPFAPTAVDLSALARSVTDDLLIRQSERRIQVNVEDDLTAVADPILARLLLENLLDNAVKYTGHREEAVIEVARVEADASLGTFVVRDNGDGFDSADAGRLFRPLTRLHTDAEFPGTGLGLASVARIVELHGGRVRAEGRKSVGAEIFFSLPVAA
ncbi:HAMP domain-containing sensor histidine kinase [Microbacterium sp. X-17]|uniref:sensor histidine kinase n=1 Tax=Microbacterium sp. X-17 TaxID=3144404 RepID=UPI0031F55780